MSDDSKQEAAITPRAKPKAERLLLGNQKLNPSTLMMGHGYDPMLSERAIKPPIFLTSTFVFESAEAGKRHFGTLIGKRKGEADGLIYSRFNNPNQEILEDRLSLWDEAEDALVFSSGMSAIGSCLMAYANQGDIILHSGPLYAASETIIGKILARFGVRYMDFPAEISPADFTKLLEKAQKAAAETGGKVSLIFLESPANPTNKLVDIEGLSQARDTHYGDAEKPPIAIDNTFLGPLWQKPLSKGADIVIYSLTKYVGGHSDLVAGSVLGSKAMIDPIRAFRNSFGTICDPHTAWMITRSLETLDLRMTRAGENAQIVCEFLRDHPKVERLGYLGFIDDPRQQDIFDRHCTGFGSTFSLFIKGGEAQSFAFLDALQIAKLAVSLGGTETLASHPAGMTHLSVPDERRAELGITDNLVRVSVGIEDPKDLIADFAQALDQVE